MEAGYGKARLTPPVGVALAGYRDPSERRATHVSDHLYARALVVRDGERKWLLICCDLLEMSARVACDVRTAVRRYGFTDEDTMFVCTHTHTGPALVCREGLTPVDGAYAETVSAVLVRAAEGALRDLCRVSKAQRMEAPLQRRFMRDCADEHARVDDVVRGLKLERPGAPAIALISCACRPNARGRVTGISADYPGKLVALMTGMHAIFLTGCAGDIEPIVPESADRHALVERIAGDIRAAYLEKPRPCAATLDVGRLTCALTQPVSVPFARIGEAVICALPFEANTRAGERIRQKLPKFTVLALGYAEQPLDDLSPGDAERVADMVGEALAERFSGK